MTLEQAIVQSFLAGGSEPSVPCLSRFVYQMDKVELRGRLEIAFNGPPTGASAHLL
jgi:hypothetical protein